MLSIQRPSRSTCFQADSIQLAPLDFIMLRISHSVIMAEDWLACLCRLQLASSPHSSHRASLRPQLGDLLEYYASQSLFGYKAWNLSRSMIAAKSG